MERHKNANTNERIIDSLFQLARTVTLCVEVLATKTLAYPRFRALDDETDTVHRLLLSDYNPILSLHFSFFSFAKFVKDCVQPCFVDDPRDPTQG